MGLEETDDRRRGIMAGGVTPTLDLMDLEIGSGNVLCGSEETGAVKVTGRIVPLGAGWDGSLCYEGPDCPLQIDPFAESDHEKVEFTVVGPPADLELSAEPGSLLCDGAAASTVSATITDSEGAAVADGNEVRFDVRVLATADPIVARTVSGSTASTVIPLSGALQGVPVRVTVGDLWESVLLSCEEAMSPPAPQAPPSPPPAATFPPIAIISPPATGSGG